MLRYLKEKKGITLINILCYNGIFNQHLSKTDSNKSINTSIQNLYT